MAIRLRLVCVPLLLVVVMAFVGVHADTAPTPKQTRSAKSGDPWTLKRWRSGGPRGVTGKEKSELFPVLIRTGNSSGVRNRTPGPPGRACGDSRSAALCRSSSTTSPRATRT